MGMGKRALSDDSLGRAGFPKRWIASPTLGLVLVAEEIWLTLHSTNIEDSKLSKRDCYRTIPRIVVGKNVKEGGRIAGV